MGKIRDDQPVSTRPLPATPGWSDPASWAREDGSGSFAPLLEAFVPGGGPGGAGVQKQAPPPGVTPGGRIGPPTYVPLPGGAAVPDPGELGRPGGAIRVPPLPPNAIISGQIQDALGAKPQDTRLAILDGLVARGRADLYVPLSGHTYAIGYDRTTGQLSLADPERPDAKHPWMSLHDLARRLHIDPDDLDPNRHASLKTALNNIVKLDARSCEIVVEEPHLAGDDPGTVETSATVTAKRGEHTMRSAAVESWVELHTENPEGTEAINVGHAGGAGSATAEAQLQRGSEGQLYEAFGYGGCKWPDGTYLEAEPRPGDSKYKPGRP